MTQPTITGRQQTPLYWGHRWYTASYGAGDANGKYDIRVTRLTPDFDEERNYGKFNWNVLRTITTGSPVPVSGVAMIAVRIKGTGQLQGTIDEYNVEVQTMARDWNGSAWVWRQTSSPAALIRHMLQHPARRKPATDAQIDLARLAYWDGVTRPTNRVFNGVFDSKTSLYDALMRVARLGRAVMTLRDLKYSVVIDEPKTAPVRMFSPRNSWGYEGEMTVEPTPHGYRLSYVNAAENSRTDELVVYDDGYGFANATLDRQGRNPRHQQSHPGLQGRPLPHRPAAAAPRGAPASTPISSTSPASAATWWRCSTTSSPSAWRTAGSSREPRTRRTSSTSPSTTR